MMEIADAMEAGGDATCEPYAQYGPRSAGQRFGNCNVVSCLPFGQFQCPTILAEI